MPAAWQSEEDADSLPDPAETQETQENRPHLAQAAAEAEVPNVPPNRQFRDSLPVPGTSGRLHRDVIAEEVRLWMENREVMLAPLSKAGNDEKAKLARIRHTGIRHTGTAYWHWHDWTGLDWTE
jgi:hypothetical protein